MSLIQEALKRQQDEMSRQNEGKADAPAHNPPPHGDEPAAPSVLSIKKTDTPPATSTQPSSATRSAKDEEVVITPLPAVPGPPVAAPEPPLSQGNTTQEKAPPPALPKKNSAARKTQSNQDSQKKEKNGTKAPLMILLILLVLILLGVGATLGARYLATRTETSLGAMVAELPIVLERAMSGTNTTGVGTATDSAPPPPPPIGEANRTDTAETEGGTIGAADLTENGEAPDGTETTAAPKQWPRIKLTAIVGKGKNGAAMLNGEVVATGDVIEQVTVISIDDDGVELEFFGEKRFLRTGALIE